ncbi:MAG: alpha/beta fold hydrolase, partial [Pseudonocardiaceae bacterium]
LRAMHDVGVRRAGSAASVGAPPWRVRVVTSPPDSTSSTVSRKATSADLGSDVQQAGVRVNLLHLGVRGPESDGDVGRGMHPDPRPARPDVDHPAEVFEVMVLTLPGFGFSGPTREGGWTVPRIAGAWAELMRRLGHDRYAAAQSTHPQRLAYALTDSSVGRLAWMVDLFGTWADSKEAPEDTVDRNTLLTNVMLYWLTGAPPGPQPTSTGTAQPSGGGHFAALEEPDLMVADLRDSFRWYRTRY